MADLLKELEAQITGLKTSTARQNVGVIREVGDGVARVEGLTDAMLNEMLDLGHGITGLALNLEETIRRFRRVTKSEQPANCCRSQLGRAS
jgi:F-type H+/Na+-transporting ATPase subunit alpha